MPVKTELREDLLTSADQIAEYIGWPVHRIYYAVRCGHLPIGKVGQLLVARKSELDAALSGAAMQATKTEEVA